MTIKSYHVRQFSLTERLLDWRLPVCLIAPVILTSLIIPFYDQMMVPIVFLGPLALLSVIFAIWPDRAMPLAERIVSPSRREMDLEALNQRALQACAFVAAWFDEHASEGSSDIELGVYLEPSYFGTLLGIQALVLKGTDTPHLPMSAQEELWSILDPASDPRWVRTHDQDLPLSWVRRPGQLQYSHHERMKALVRVDRAEQSVTADEQLDPQIAWRKRAAAA